MHSKEPKAWAEGIARLLPLESLPNTAMPVQVRWSLPGRRARPERGAGGTTSVSMTAPIYHSVRFT